MRRRGVIAPLGGAAIAWLLAFPDARGQRAGPVDNSPPGGVFNSDRVIALQPVT